MSTLTLLPAGVTVEVAAGASLLQSIIDAGGKLARLARTGRKFKFARIPREATVSRRLGWAQRLGRRRRGSGTRSEPAPGQAAGPHRATVCPS